MGGVSGPASPANTLSLSICVELGNAFQSARMFCKRGAFQVGSI